MRGTGTWPKGQKVKSREGKGGGEARRNIN